MDFESVDGLDRVGELILGILEEQVPSAKRRSEIMGSVWQQCFEAVRQEPAPYRAAQDEEALRALLTNLVESALAGPDETARGATLRSGCLGTFIDAQLRTLSEPEEVPAAEAANPLQTEPHPLVADAAAKARSEGNATLLRNVGWMVKRDDGLSYDAIADESGCPPPSVRTGVRRARQAVRRIAQEKRRAVNAPHQGECPGELRAARDAWKAGDLAGMGRELGLTRASLASHPYFLFLSALLADDSGDRETAVELFTRILVADDDVTLRAKVLNCLGYIADDRPDRGLAHAYWSRAIRVDPNHTPAHVNLLKNACDRKDKLDVHVCIDRIGELLTSRSLTASDKEYLVMRLREHPDFQWARGFEAWRKGPARWIARVEREGRPRPSHPPRAARTAALIVLAMLALLFAWRGGARDDAASHREPVLEQPAASEIAGSGDRGGHRPRPGGPRASLG